MNRQAFLGFFVFLSVAIALCTLSHPASASGITREIVPLEREGVKLHLECLKAEDGGEKEPLLMVHGLTYSSHEFDVNYGDYSLARFLAQNGYAVWLLDIAGYGSSQPVEDGFKPNSPTTPRRISPPPSGSSSKEAAKRAWTFSAGVGAPSRAAVLPRSTPRW